MNQLELHITHLNGRIDAIETRINSIHTSLDMLTQTSDIMHHFLREWRNQQNAAEVAIVRIFDAVADMMADMRHSQAQVHGLQPQDQPAEQAESDHGEGIEEDNHDAASSTCCEEDQ